MTRFACRTLLALTAVASLGLAGCSSTAIPAPTETVTAAAPSTAAAPASPSSPPATAASAPATAASPSSAAASSPDSNATKLDPNAPAGQCKDSALEVTVQYDPEAAGAGQRGAFVVLRNAGDTSCHLQGTPGLSLVGSDDGTQIGQPAQRITSGAKLVTLAPGKAALAAVQYTYVDKNGGLFNDGDGHDPSCRAKAADGYRIYPPHSYRAYFSPDKTYACSTDRHWITVRPVRPATDFPYFNIKN